MVSENEINFKATLAERVRSRREELRLTREDLVDQILAMPGRKKVGLSTIKSMEKVGDGSYSLPKRKWGEGDSSLELVATALNVPVGYFLAAFTDAEISASQFGHAVRTGRITLVPILRDQEQQSNSLSTFLKKLPTTEQELFDLPLHSYRNQFAVVTIFRIERHYPGLEMLVVNDPPLIFWDNDDVVAWAGNMNLDGRDLVIFLQEFKEYRAYFRLLVEQNRKNYKVVINFPTLARFMSRKTTRTREALIEDMCSFAKRSNFNLVLHNPDVASKNRHLNSDQSIEAHEREILCKHKVIPASLKDTVSIQIMSSPPHQKPVGYFVGPAPKDMVLIQREIDWINDAWASSLDQYREAIQKSEPSLRQLETAAIRNHTISLLKSLSAP